jgi:hypothetical protein
MANWSNFFSLRQTSHGQIPSVAEAFSEAGDGSAVSGSLNRAFRIGYLCIISDLKRSKMMFVQYRILLMRHPGRLKKFGSSRYAQKTRRAATRGVKKDDQPRPSGRIGANILRGESGSKSHN